MARSEARLSVDIWNDADFLALSPTAQRQYMFLLSQADLAHTGVIALRERRWARSAAGLTVADVERDLKELESARFVVVDQDAEELLIRAFMRRDKVYRQPQVLSVAADQLTLVSSLPIRVALRLELERIAELGMVAASAALVTKMLDALGETRAYQQPGDLRVIAGGEGGPHPGGKGVGKGAQEALGDWGVVTAVTTDSPKPQASSPDPQASSPKRPGKPAKPKPTTADAHADAEFMKWRGIYPNVHALPDTYRAYLNAREKISAEELYERTAAYADAVKRAGTALKYIPHSTTFLNQERYNDKLPQVDRASGQPIGRQPYANPTDTSVYHGAL